MAATIASGILGLGGICAIENAWLSLKDLKNNIGFQSNRGVIERVFQVAHSVFVGIALFTAAAMWSPELAFLAAFQEACIAAIPFLFAGVACGNLALAARQPHRLAKYG